MLEAMFVLAALRFQTGLELSSLVLVEASENEETKTILFMTEKEINRGDKSTGPKGGEPV